jgi:fatty-acyl-CoA synthase
MPDFSATLVQRVAEAAAGPKAITFVGPAEAQRVTWGQLHEEALAMAAALQGRGIGPGDHVALLGTTSRPLVTAVQATWLAGATVVMLPLPMRLGSMTDFVDQTRARVRGADAKLLLFEPALGGLVQPAAGDPPMLALDELAAARGDARYEAPAVSPADLAILQFTSGSTAAPKGVMLPHGQVCANLDAIAEASRLDVDDDVLVSWLPLYHDMGLIGLLSLPMSTGTDLVLAGPQDFLGSPSRWLTWMSEYGGTATAGPNFSYALAARAMGRMDGLDLSRLRLALNGAEPVDPSAVDAFCSAGARHGLDARAMFPAFGMAEATLAVTFPTPFTGLRLDTVDRRVLESDRYAAPVEADAPGARPLARLGSAVPGLSIRIVDADTGEAMGEREVGELEVRGTSVTTGYYRDPDATAMAFRSGTEGPAAERWLRTGDLGYLLEGELVVCGRSKDMIIVGGRNVFPEDVERAAANVEGVRAGNVIAFGVEGRKGREGLVVVAETRAGDPSPVRDAVALRVRQAVGLPPEDVVLVAPGSLPKTSSGKLQRSLCRSHYLESVLQPV